MANHAALIRAENAGLPVTRKGRRFLEFALPDGKTRHVATIEPLHTRTTQAEIDTTWVADTGAWQWKLAQADFQAHARSVFNVGSLIEWRHESGEWVVVDPQSINWINQDNSRQQIAIKQAVTGSASDMTLTFPNAYGAGRHFSYTAHPRRLIKHFTLDASLPDPTITGTIWFEVEWSIANSAGVELYLDGVRWARTNNVRVRTGNAIEFRNAGGEVLWYADAPMATDANGETITAQYEVRRQGGGYFITVRVPREWLLSASYPVTVDPTFTDGYGGDVTTAKDTDVNTNSPTYNYGVYASMGVYRNALKGLLEFDLSSIDSAATCDSATLYLYGASTTTAEAWTAYVWSIASGNDGWPEGNENGAAGGAGDCCWDHYDQDPGGETNWAGSAGLSTVTTDYESPSIGSFSGNREDAVGTEYTSALTTARVEGWFDSPNTNYGIMLWCNSTTVRTQGFCSSDHGTTGYRPVLVVEYTTAGSASPSASPSGSPSATPSASPSEGTPSGSPSRTPSASPSEGTPSASPSEGTPSASPSEGTPSASPSEGTPSASPSEGTPSASPSEGTPSASPSEGTPSGSPSRTPSASPSEGTPSGSPSHTPSASPSEGTPSASPSEGTPSASPSEGTPSASPSEGTPSGSPSHTPSASPSEGTPSGSPTGTPSASPSEGTPSASPSEGTPSASPSEGTPSASPSEGTPSASPSEGTPSASPSEGTPSTSPSEGTPSGSPSHTPSASPSEGTPSASPSEGTPSGSPSRTPSASPSEGTPSGSPSRTPSASPSEGTPSGSPSASPSEGTPSASPSEGTPSGSPSPSPSEAPEEGVCRPVHYGPQEEPVGDPIPTAWDGVAPADDPIPIDSIFVHDADLDEPVTAYPKPHYGQRAGPVRSLII